MVVATQVAEAGLDVNSLAVYTSAAPLESLVQRAGRACRRRGILEHCRREGGRVVVVKDSSPGPYPRGEVEEALKAVGEAVAKSPKALDWRAPCNPPGRIGYGSLLARAGGSTPGRRSPAGVAGRLYRLYLEGDARPEALWDILGGACSLVRDSALVEVEVPGSTVAASLDWILRHAAEVLEPGGTDAPLLVVRTQDGHVVEAEAGSAWRAWSTIHGGASRAGVDCRRLIEALHRDAMNALEGAGIRDSALASIHFKAKEDAYIEGLGLLLPSERPGGAGR